MKYMSLFENLSFLNEGEQADAYRARKAKEAEKAKRKDHERTSNRSSISYNMIAKNKDPKRPRPRTPEFDKFYDKSEQFENDVNNVIDRIGPEYIPPKNRDDITDPNSEYHKHTKKYEQYRYEGKDAVARDIRRHPERWSRDSDGKLHREFTIFESVEFI